MATSAELEQRLEALYTAARELPGSDPVNDLELMITHPLLTVFEASQMHTIAGELVEIRHRRAPGYYELEIIPESCPRVELAFRILTDSDTGELAIFGGIRATESPCPLLPGLIETIDQRSGGILLEALNRTRWIYDQFGRFRTAPRERGLRTISRIDTTRLAVELERRAMVHSL